MESTEFDPIMSVIALVIILYGTFQFLAPSMMTRRKAGIETYPAKVASMSRSDGTSTNLHSNAVTPIKECDVVHFCFIVHGHKGKPTDLSYLHHVIKQKAKEQEEFVIIKSSNNCTVGVNDSLRNPIPDMDSRKENASIYTDQNVGSSKTTFEDVTINEPKGSAFIVHNATCNEGLTHDGIEKGGSRLAFEILDVIRSELDSRAIKHKQDVTISIVGNSLGGLYGRYAVAMFDELLFASEEDDDEMQYYILDDYIHIYFNIFCSTASPHLGCADRTYVSIPRIAELGIAKSLGQTGRDLFRVNDLIKTMATSPKYIGPLALFRKRIAYANVYGTDFVVPGSTAAFLDGNSDSLHYFNADDGSVKEGQAQRNEVNECPASERGLLVASCYTKCLPLSDLSPAVNELECMSKVLDSLGWTKVFVNIRKEILVSATMPLLKDTDDCPIRRLSSKQNAVSSKDLCHAISSVKDSRFILPFGHNAMCAYERGSFSTTFNKGGRPVMDSLARNLVQDISLWTHA